MRKLILIGVMTVISCGIFAQEDPGIKVLGKATKRSIQLRWAPNSPVIWDLANKYGYTVERVKLLENGKMLKEPVKEIISGGVLKPAPQAQWSPFLANDDYVAVAAQAIYGETFELTEDFNSDLSKIIDKAKELDNRFSFGLFAADQSVKAAQLSGLYLEDELIAPGTKYVYRVYANIPPDIIEVDTGAVYIGMEDYRELPVVPDLKVKFDDHLALLSWDGGVLDKVYNSFWVERSDDGGNTFRRVTSEPVVNGYNGDRPNTRMMIRIDSLPSNNTKYWYRIRGIDSFGEVGPPSDTVSGSGKPLFSVNSEIVSHEISSTGQVTVGWTFPVSGVAQLKGFDLLRFDQKTQTYSSVATDISPSARAYRDEKPRATNYYVISSKDRYGRRNNSFPYLVQLEDSIPPVKPMGFRGNITTEGLVRLSWQANPEEDIAGYKLFRANFKDNQFIEVPGEIIASTEYVDTISLGTMTETVYYKVQALDFRFNPSELSDPLMLEKPDLVPPNPPVFSSIKSDSLGVLLDWQASSSQDVVEYLLYRKSEDDAKWGLIRSLSADQGESFFLDRSVKHRKAYAYTMVAVDDAGIESDPAPPVSIKWRSTDPYPAIENIFFNIDQEGRKVAVSWDYSQSGVSTYKIYKSVNGRPFTLVKTVTGETSEWQDDFGVNDEVFRYRIVATFSNGDSSGFSKILNVNF